MIPIVWIDVLDPQSRNKRMHWEIVGNIEAMGLKRPITVSLRPGSWLTLSIVRGNAPIRQVEAESW